MIKANKTKRKSVTSLLCELTRLKSQQKYLECNQVKLNPKAVIVKDYKHQDEDTDITNIITELENLKTEIQTDLKKYRNSKCNDLQHFSNVLNSLRDEIGSPLKLKNCSMNAMKGRVIKANTELEQIKTKNEEQLKCLKKQHQLLQEDLRKYCKYIP